MALACVFAVSLVLALVITPIVCRCAIALHLVDKPDARKVHRAPVPRIGGVAIGLAVLGAIFIDALLGGPVHRSMRSDLVPLSVVLVAAACVFIVGMLDDLFNLPSKFKLLVLLGAAVAVCGTGSRIDTMHLGTATYVVGWASWPLTMLWIVGICVGLNFIDGLDGLAAGIGFIAAGALAVVAAVNAQWGVMGVSLSLAGALLGFLAFNFNPASIFMGDCGSLLIGFLLPALTARCVAKTGSITVLLLPLLALSVPIFDTAFTMIRRGVLQRRSLFSAERGHIHHRLMDLGLCQRQAVLILYSVTLVATGLGLVTLLNTSQAALIVVAAALVMLLGLFRYTGACRPREVFNAIKRNRAIGKEAGSYQKRFENMQLRFRLVKSFDGWWDEVCAAADAMNFLRVSLPLQRRDGSETMMVWNASWRAKSLDMEKGLARQEILAATIPIRQRRLGGISTGLRAIVEVVADRSVELAGRRLALFARLLEEHSVADLPLQLIARDTIHPPEAALAAAEVGDAEVSPRKEQSSKLSVESDGTLLADEVIETAPRRRAIGEILIESASVRGGDRDLAAVGTEELREQTTASHASGACEVDATSDANRSPDPSGRTDAPADSNGHVSHNTNPSVDATTSLNLSMTLASSVSLNTQDAAANRAASHLMMGPATGMSNSLISGDSAATPLSRRSSPVIDSKTKIAIVHDFLYTYAGAERVLEQILHLYPQADLFSLFDFLPANQRGFIQGKKVNCSFIQKLPMARSKHRAYLPLMPLAIEQLDVSAYDIVISSSYVAAKGVLTGPDQLHLSYCHSPVRYAWDLQHQYLEQSNLTRGLKSIFARAVLHYIRTWDTRTANGVDVFMANSNFVGRRIEKVYHRNSTIIYPPVDTENFKLHPKKEDFYVTVSRMVPYKKVDLIVEAFNRMPNKRLIVIGEGPDYEKIKTGAGSNVKMLGHQPFDVVREYMQRAKAFVFAAEEDFGIVPVEAQACGTPVIAYGAGGVTESVIPGRTGMFFLEQTPDCLVRAVREFESVENWDYAAIRANAEKFSVAHFREQFADVVRDAWAAFQVDGVEVRDEAFPGVGNLDLPPRKSTPFREQPSTPVTRA
jgi:UDP-N-acetylmuramyl pentapeptide phosphotransferase/UDP-N-acetylglucosamine-1-phosphate transferase/glycosyltransferase involved in cell wall biosynthesis